MDGEIHEQDKLPTLLRLGDSRRLGDSPSRTGASWRPELDNRLCSSMNLLLHQLAELAEYKISHINLYTIHLLIIFFIYEDPVTSVNQTLLQKRFQMPKHNVFCWKTPAKSGNNWETANNDTPLPHQVSRTHCSRKAFPRAVCRPRTERSRLFLSSRIGCHLAKAMTRAISINIMHTIAHVRIPRRS